MNTATEAVYADINTAFLYLNHEFFDDGLPVVAVTLQRKAHSAGYYAANRFANRQLATIAEIALNPDAFLQRSEAEVLSTLAHEMVHCWQVEVMGRKPRAYHDAEFAAKMLEMGLQCSDTGQPGGNATGTKMSHYIVPMGRFVDVAEHLSFLCISAWGSVELPGDKRRTAESKVKFTCPECGQNAWAKPGAVLLCGACEPGHVFPHIMVRKS